VPAEISEMDNNSFLLDDSATMQSNNASDSQKGAFFVRKAYIDVFKKDE